MAVKLELERAIFGDTKRLLDLEADRGPVAIGAISEQDVGAAIAVMGAVGAIGLVRLVFHTALRLLYWLSASDHEDTRKPVRGWGLPIQAAFHCPPDRIKRK